MNLRRLSRQGVLFGHESDLAYGVSWRNEPGRSDRARLDTVAHLFNALKARGRSGTETLVPVVFRPYHELSGSWFWWGKNHASRDDVIALWRFTVDYLRRDRGVHNLLYAYSTDVFDSKDAYLDRYPGATCA